jgi:hypothetical protein
MMVIGWLALAGIVAFGVYCFYKKNIKTTANDSVRNQPSIIIDDKGLFILTGYDSLIIDRNILPIIIKAVLDNVAVISSGNYLTPNEVYHLSVIDTPTPLGTKTIAGTNKEIKNYIISWNNDFERLGLRKVIDFRISLRFVPTISYPCLLFVVQLNDGQKDGQGNISCLQGEYNFNLHRESHRLNLYELFHADDIGIFVFNKNEMDYQYLSLTLHNSDRRQIKNEIKAAFCAMGDYSNINVASFENGITEIASSYHPGGQPANQNAHTLFEKRKKYSPPPEKWFWDKYV